MNCMRCGKETTEKNVFCPECLAEIEQYPVMPGTVIQIPARPETPEHRKPARRKKEPPMEVQLDTMRTLVRNLTAMVIASVTALAVVTGVLLYILIQPDPADQAPAGRNYSTVSTTTGN